MLFAATVKLIIPFIIVIPGIVAFVLYKNEQISNPYDQQSHNKLNNKCGNKFNKTRHITHTINDKLTHTINNILTNIYFFLKMGFLALTILRRLQLLWQ